jgi:hypothetical protein
MRNPPKRRKSSSLATAAPANAPLSPSVGADPLSYSIFVLSAWEERGGHAGDNSAWRFSLEGSQISGRKGFGSLPELVAYLEEWTRSVHPADPSLIGPAIFTNEEEPSP